MSFRFASTSDCRAMLEIYSQYIDTTITFETVLPPEKEFTDRIRSITSEYPWIVWEEDGRVRGYAYAHRLHERAAYQWDAELSAYLDKNCVARGMGKRLLLTLFDILRLQRVHTVYSLVTSPNERSEHLQQSLGFRHIGTHRSTGFKNGKWTDVNWFELPIMEYEPDPEPFIGIGKIDPNELSKILRSS